MYLEAPTKCPSFWECVISGHKKLRTNTQGTTRLSMSLYECITVGAGVCMTVFCMCILLCVHLRARAGAGGVLPTVSAGAPCHLERKSSVKYSIVWDQAPWQWLSS